MFLDPDKEQVALAAESGSQRIELYTESYAQSWATPDKEKVLANYREVALKAQELGLGVNAGHDLDMKNLADFLSIPDILEVSIGHALIIECIELGMDTVVARYLDITSA